MLPLWKTDTQNDRCFSKGEIQSIRSDIDGDGGQAPALLENPFGIVEDSTSMMDKKQTSNAGLFCLEIRAHCHRGMMPGFHQQKMAGIRPAIEFPDGFHIAGIDDNAFFGSNPIAE